MNSAHQVSLFGAGDPAFDPRIGGLTRHQLDAGAWVDHLEGWVTGHEHLFDQLVDDAQWESRSRRMYDRVVDVPRLMSRCPSGASGAIVRRMSLALSVRYGRALPSIALNWYRDGEDSVAMHSDRVGERISDTVIAIVSVGEPRRFNLRSRDGHGGKSFKLGWGDLIVMGGTSQRDWLHGVPKARHAGPRMSIVFREHAN